MKNSIAFKSAEQVFIKTYKLLQVGDISGNITYKISGLKEVDFDEVLNLLGRIYERNNFTFQLASSLTITVIMD
jgi:hypothetical protein